MKKIAIEKLEYDNDFRTEEGYKILRTNLEFCGKDIKVIAITSCEAREGKTTVSLKLGESIADIGKKVIIIDADMRRSVMIRGLKGKTILGLSHYLCGKYALEDVICNSHITNLDVIFAGPVPPNPSELLESYEFIDLIEYLKQRYDYIIIDTPPLGEVIDAAIISKSCDGAVIVIEVNRVSCKMLQKVINQLRRANCKILGTVLNKVLMKSSSYYSEYSKSYE